MTSWHEFQLRVKGHEKALQEQWERTRWVAWQNVLISPNIKTGSKPRTAQAFCTFPWEKMTDDELKAKAEQYRVTPEEIKELNRIMAEWEQNNSRITT